MTNLPVPTLPNEVPGNFIASAVFNTVGLNGLGFMLNPPCAILQQATAQSVANTTATAVTFDAETLDTYGGHSITTNTSRYVAQVPGYYLVIGGVSYATNAAGNRLAQLEKNGTTFAQQVFFTPTTANGASVQVSGVCYLNGTGDYVETWTYQTSGGALSTSAGSSSMSVLWIHS